MKWIFICLVWVLVMLSIGIVFLIAWVWELSISKAYLAAKDWGDYLIER